MNYMVSLCSLFQKKKKKSVITKKENHKWPSPYQLVRREEFPLQNRMLPFEEVRWT